MQDRNKRLAKVKAEYVDHSPPSAVPSLIYQSLKEIVTYPGESQGNTFVISGRETGYEQSP